MSFTNISHDTSELVAVTLLPDYVPLSMISDHVK